MEAERCDLDLKYTLFGVNMFHRCCLESRDQRFYRYQIYDLVVLENQEDGNLK